MYKDKVAYPQIVLNGINKLNWSALAKKNLQQQEIIILCYRFIILKILRFVHIAKTNI